MNNVITKTRAAAKHSSKGTRSGGVLTRKTKTEKVDWAFRRLRNQAVRFFAGNDIQLRRELHDVLEPARTYEQIQKEITGVVGPRRAPKAWTQFMNTFFSHRINKHVSA